MKKIYASESVKGSTSGVTKSIIVEWIVVLLAFAILIAGYIGLHVYIYRRLATGLGINSSYEILSLKVILILLPLFFPFARLWLGFQ
jgi:hypothetical protein